ncbi:hypothetical protein PG989_006967 [Apiospora arundinis]
MRLPRIQQLSAQLQILETVFFALLLGFTLAPHLKWLLVDISDHQDLISSIGQFVDISTEVMVDLLDRITDDIVTGHANTPLCGKGSHFVWGVRPDNRPPKQPGFHYTHLETGELRLLILRPGKADMPLECELAVYHRTHHAKYEALSYAWGDTAKREQVICNGSPLPVTGSLHSALRHLRSPTESRQLWVDAVCIDQDDAAEKAAQISLMDTIYSEAERVLVWLGPGIPETKPAFRLVNRVVRLISQSSYCSLIGSLGASCSDYVMPDYVDFSPSNEFDRLSKQDLNPLIKLLELPWFSRLWVYQEVALAKQVRVLWGEEAIPWDRLAQSIMHLNCKGVFLEHTRERSPAGVKAVVEMEKVRRGSKDRLSRDLISLLLATSEAQCTDPRDKIYAILNLVTEVDGPLGSGRALRVEVDYEAEAGKVYQRFATTSISMGDLRVLSCVSQHRYSTSNHMENVPSWVPDWTAVENDTPFILLNLTAAFPTSDRLYSENPPEVTDEGVLLLPCITIDYVQGVVPTTAFTKTPLVKPWSPDDYESLQRTLEWLRASQDLVQTHANESLIEMPIYEALCIAITASLTGNSRPATTEQYVQWFLQYRGFLEATADSFLSRRLPQQQENSQATALPLEISTRSNDDPAISSSSSTSTTIMTTTTSKLLAAIEASIYMWSSKRLLGVTQLGRVVLVPKGTQEGDRIVLPTGSVVPLVLRYDEERGFYTLLGEAFVHDVMNGDLVRRFKETHTTMEDSPYYATLAIR